MRSLRPSNNKTMRAADEMDSRTMRGARAEMEFRIAKSEHSSARSHPRWPGMREWNPKADLDALVFVTLSLSLIGGRKCVRKQNNLWVRSERDANCKINYAVWVSLNFKKTRCWRGFLIFDFARMMRHNHIFNIHHYWKDVIAAKLLEFSLN